jgi:hypothetical protein
MVTRTSKLVLITLLIFLIALSTTLAAKRTFTVQETDLVKIVPEAIDPDEDKIVYYFSPPLDDDGEWQTGYDDAGTHTIEITASDGLSQTIEEVVIIVENKNQAPYISQNKLEITENELINLKEFVVDPDDDPLSYHFESPFNSEGLWTPNYNSAGNFVTEFTISDGEFETEARVEITVSETNQLPVVLNSFATKNIFNVNENEDLKFFVKANDGDGDKISYNWSLDGQFITEESSGEYYFDYESSGEHSLILVMGDGVDEYKQEWTIVVEHVNRKPILETVPITINEGEKLSLDLPDLDLDGDELVYTFEEPLNEEGEWELDYDSADDYTLRFSAFDGEFTTNVKLYLTVVDVDRAPVLNVPEMLEIKENEELIWNIDSYDEDGDKVTISFENFPESAIYINKGKTFSWTPGYDFIRRSGGFFSNVMNSLRLEHLFLKKKSSPLTVTSCGKDKCSVEEVEIIVYNVNRAPILPEENSVEFTETENIKVSLQAYDPDGDIVRTYYTKPLGKRSGEWKTDYDDEGHYAIYVTATDGRLGTTVPVGLDILKKNRQPSIKVKEDELVVNEGQEFTVRIVTSDPDNDPLNLSINYLPPGASFYDGIFVWKPGYNTVNNKTDSFSNNFASKLSFLNRKYNSEQFTLWLEFTVTDGEFIVNHPIQVTVKNVNIAPEIVDYLPVEPQPTVYTGDEMVFNVVTEDFDNNKLTFEWDFGVMETGVTGTNSISRVFKSAGEKKVKVTVSDGRLEVEKEWVVKVLESKKPVTSTSKPVPTENGSFRVYVIKS